MDCRSNSRNQDMTHRPGPNRHSHWNRKKIIYSGARTDRIDAGLAADIGVAVKPAQIWLHRGRSVENILHQRRIFGDRRTAPGPILQRQPYTQPVDDVIGRARAYDQIAVVKRITISGRHRNAGPPLAEKPAHAGSTRRQGRQCQQYRQPQPAHRNIPLIHDQVEVWTRTAALSTDQPPANSARNVNRYYYLLPKIFHRCQKSFTDDGGRPEHRCRQRSRHRRS